MESSRERAAFTLSAAIKSELEKGEGRPSLQDCIYHAVALVEGGTFVTADERHVRKTAHHGSVALLREWNATAG